MKKLKWRIIIIIGAIFLGFEPAIGEQCRDAGGNIGIGDGLRLYFSENLNCTAFGVIFTVSGDYDELILRAPYADKYNYFGNCLAALHAFVNQDHAFDYKGTIEKCSSYYGFEIIRPIADPVHIRNMIREAYAGTDYEIRTQ